MLYIQLFKNLIQFNIVSNFLLLCNWKCLPLCQEKASTLHNQNSFVSIFGDYFLHLRKMRGITHSQIVPILPGLQVFNATWKQILHILSVILLIQSQIRISIAAEFLCKYILRCFFSVTGRYTLALWNCEHTWAWQAGSP